MLEQGFCVLIDGGFSPANSVYVDNVVDAIELAIQEDNAVGRALTIIDGQTTTWRGFFSSYAKMFSNPPPLLNITSKEIGMEKRRRSLKLLEKMFWNPRQTPNILPGLVNLSADVSRMVSLALKLHPIKRVS